MKTLNQKMNIPDKWMVLAKLVALAILWFVISPFVAQVVMVLLGVMSFIMPSPVVDHAGIEHVFVLSTPLLLMALYCLKQWQFARAAYYFVSFMGMMWSIYLLHEVETTTLIDATLNV